jgi:hypothetical protein
MVPQQKVEKPNFSIHHIQEIRENEKSSTNRGYREYYQNTNRDYFHISVQFEYFTKVYGLDWIGLDWIGLWVGLGSILSRCFDLDSALIDVDDSFSILISIPLLMGVSRLSAALFPLS